MDREIFGVHHVTAIASDPNRNIAFYTEILGLRLVKLTVNFDDPGSYHFYYGDEVGHPGTLLTFFVWPDAPRGRKGSRQVAAVTFGIPFGSMSFWMDRLHRHDGAVGELTERFNEEALTFNDPDGVQLELIEVRATRRIENKYGPIPVGHAITGIHGVTLLESALQETDSLLTHTLGFNRINQEGNRTRYVAGPTGHGRRVDLVHVPHEPRSSVAVGMVHHVAWRVANEEQQRSWREQIVDVGLNVTPVIDRRYFKSIYFREPGGVLFELATDPPGFTIDEEPDKLGTRLVLPPWLESERRQIEERLPLLTLPKFHRAA
ncbi:MAG: ring-cleaving dioxygenase [Desulfomonilaceae bacterium]